MVASYDNKHSEDGYRFSRFLALPFFSLAVRMRREARGRIGELVSISR